MSSERSTTLAVGVFELKQQSTKASLQDREFMLQVPSSGKRRGTAQMAIKPSHEMQEIKCPSS
jgi:hypothetical protein